ncbi:cation efflux family-domain-containing protein [Blyttiomyces helicus]|uniref:Cation efflux family-domain-containing protein n=1 Tax=Blyttiomyces helicus TaxID=388810 RepID=A0A4P9VYK4_9FUNG|nr:cation efflux family-domain-containing protein [Blyttiomyces helicus]|eukprot:RKO83843.1 cation efflux family-domain-containing protein [Blyttiomyces helicus]
MDTRTAITLTAVTRTTMATLMAMATHMMTTTTRSTDTDTTMSTTNINVQSAAIHVIGDLLSSIGVLIAAFAIWINPDLTILDPICTFVFSVFVLATTIQLMSNSLKVLMEATPFDIDSEEVVEQLLKIDGVADVHDLHVWNLTVGKVSLSAHVTIHPTNANGPVTVDDYIAILAKSQSMLCSRYGIHHATIQLETSAGVENVDVNSSSPPSVLHCQPVMCRTG